MHAPGGKTLSHKFCFQTKMPKTARSSGNWSEIQETKLQKLLDNNTIDYRNRSPDYLFEVSKEHFGDFISEGPRGRNAAVQCMQGKLQKYEEEMLLQGARGKCTTPT